MAKKDRGPGARRRKLDKILIGASRSMDRLMDMGGRAAVPALGALGAALALAGYYGRCGFDLRAFLLLELPFYALCAWAIHALRRLARRRRGGSGPWRGGA